jgi:16S rRNA (cytidine1402-2'-O)-methyltransferase
MTPRAIDVLRSVQVVATEDTRHSGRLLKAFDIDTPMVSYHHHNRATREADLLDTLISGDVALISDAGTPAIADPGHELVDAAIRAGHTVSPIPGASSTVAAVSASGLVPGPFLFVGFLPRSGEDRRVALGQAMASGFPFVLFESPLRTGATLDDIARSDPKRIVMIARELTKLHEELVRGSVRELARRYADEAPRGEVVLVVSGSSSGPNPGEVDILALARSILDQGVKPSKAARELSVMTGIDAATAYEVIRSLGPNPGSAS